MENLMSRDTLVLEQIFVGELPESEYKGENLKQKIAQIELSNNEILRKYPTEQMKEIVSEKLLSNKKTEFVDFGGKTAVKKPAKFNKMFTLQRGLVAAAVLALVLFVPLMLNQKNEATGIGNASTGVTLADSVNAERAKGTPTLFVHKLQSNGKQVLLKNGSQVFEGDTIELSYAANGAKYGLILSIDGNGVVTQHFPASGVFAGELDNSGDGKLGFAYTLDDAPDFERFLFITSDKKFSASGIENAVEKLKKSGSISRAKTEDFTKYLTFGVEIRDFMIKK